jgi:hypothetical protein
VTETFFGRDIVAGAEEVAGIETETNRKVRHLFCVFAQDVELFESSAELRAGAHGVFDEQHELRKLESRGGGGDAFEKRKQSLLDGLAFVIAGVRDQVFGADRVGSYQFATKRFDGSDAGFFVRGGEVDQVIVVDDQRVEVELFARALEELDGGEARDGGFPLPRAGGENLEGVGAEVVRFNGGVLERAGDGSVVAEAH